MPTQKTFCIDPNNGDATGYDALYTSFAGYVSAQEADLVTADENHVLKVRVGDSGQLDLTGTSWVTDGTRNIVIELENSDDHYEVSDLDAPSTALSNGDCAGIEASDYAMKLSNINVKVSDLLLYSVGGDNGGVLAGDNSPAIVENCVMIDEADITLEGFRAGTNFTGYFRNCYAYCKPPMTGSGHCFYVGSGDDECVINCTAYQASPTSLNAIAKLGDGVEAVNCLFSTYAGEDCVTKVNDSDYVILKSCAVSDESISENFDDDEKENCIENLALENVFGETIFGLAEDSTVRKQGQKPNTIGSNKDAFGELRLKYDIGYYQTLMVNGSDIEGVFKDLGVLVSVKSDYSNVVKNLINLHENSIANQMGAGAERLSVVAGLLDDNKSNYSQVGSWTDTLIRRVEEYITGYIKSLLDATGRTADEILDELDYWMGRANEYLQAVSLESNIIYDIDDSTDITCQVNSLKQNLKPQKVTVECVSDNVDGSESWTVTGSEDGSFGLQATTGELYSAEGLEFTISVNSSGYPSVGDKIYIYVNSSGGVYQRFFRDNLGFVFDNAKSDGTETISDSWAE